MEQSIRNSGRVKVFCFVHGNHRVPDRQGPDDKEFLFNMLKLRCQKSRFLLPTFVNFSSTIIGISSSRKVRGTLNPSVCTLFSHVFPLYEEEDLIQHKDC